MVESVMKFLLEKNRGREEYGFSSTVFGDDNLCLSLKVYTNVFVTVKTFEQKAFY